MSTEPRTDGSRKQRYPWDRLSGESEQVYRMFASYRDAGRPRTVASTADEWKKSRQYVYRVARKYAWTRRAEAWDAEQDRVFVETMADRRRQAATQTLAIVSFARAKLVERLRQLEWSTIGPTEARQWLETVVKLERDIVGEPQKIEISGPDGGAVGVAVGSLSDEDRMTFFRRLVAEATSRAGGSAMLREVTSDGLTERDEDVDVGTAAASAGGTAGD